MGRRLPAGDQGAARRHSARAALRPARARVVSARRERKGYTGVARLREAPAALVAGFGSREFDAEGRYLEAHFARPDGDQPLPAVRVRAARIGRHRSSASSTSSCRTSRKLRSAGREIILCGDWNIAHRAIDLRNWRSNQKNSGFLPEERAWLTRVFDELGFVDVFRRVDPRPERYTWWSNRGQAWEKNVGWRIDYQIATPGIAAKATSGDDLHAIGASPTTRRSSSITTTSCVERGHPAAGRASFRPRP